MRHLILAALFAATAGNALAATKTTKPAAGAPAAQPQGAVIDVKVRDFSARFMDFHTAASKPLPPVAPTTPPADGKQAAAPVAPATPAAPVESEADRRWRFYKSHYAFTPLTDKETSRAPLDAAWPNYAAALPRIQAGYDGIATELSGISQNLGTQLGLEKALSLRYITYVGTFDGKVWSEVDGDRLNIFLPLEVTTDVRALPFAQILGRHMLEKSAIWGNKPRNLAELLVGEGVMAHAIQATVPGKTVEAYLDLTTEQLNQAKSDRKNDLKDLIGKLGDSSPATLAEYSGPRLAQARLAGWLLVESFQKQKVSYADMIRQKSGDLVKTSQLAMAGIIRAK